MAKKTTYTITIDLNYPDGVDEPWFELSKSAGDTVIWINNTGKNLLIDFKSDNSLIFGWPQAEKISAHGRSGPHGIDPGYPIPLGQPTDKVCKLHKYDIKEGTTVLFDPGGGVRP